MRCLRLREPLALRGWDRLPHAIQDLRTGATSFLGPDEFTVLALCNGSFDLDSPLVPDAYRAIADAALKRGLVQACAEGERPLGYQAYRRAPCRFIRVAHWSITGRCNLSCRHCFMSAPHARFGELPLDRCLDIVRQLAEANIAQVTLTGGEPLVRPDFFRIVDALLERQITIVQVYSNGLRVDADLLDGFESRGIKPEFPLSFDGLGWHDWLRGADGAETAVIAAMERLGARGFQMGVETALHTLNRHTLPATMGLLQRLGVGHWKTNPAADGGEWLKEGGRYNLSVDELYRIYLDFIPVYRAAGAPLGIMLGGFFACAKGAQDYRIPGARFDGTAASRRRTVCQSARTTMYIGADGTLLPCMPMSGLTLAEPMPNLTQMPLAQALSDSTYLKTIDLRLEELLAANGRCAACEYRFRCGGGCRSAALQTSRHYLGVDEYTCRFFSGGYEQRVHDAWHGAAGEPPHAHG